MRLIGTREELKNKEQRGITLIALVVTIIVLLLLAGVSIMTLTGQNGILKRAREAKLVTSEAEVREEIEHIYAEWLIDKKVGEAEETIDGFWDRLIDADIIEDVGAITEVEEGKRYQILTKDKFLIDINIDEKGNISFGEVENLNEAPPILTSMTSKATTKSIHVEVKLLDMTDVKLEYYYKKEEEEESAYKKIEVGEIETEIDINNIEMNANYNIKLVARNKKGEIQKIINQKTGSLPVGMIEQDGETVWENYSAKVKLKIKEGEELEEGTVIRYRKNGGEWEEYTGELTGLKNNDTIDVQLYDGYNGTEEALSIKVSDSETPLDAVIGFTASGEVGIFTGKTMTTTVKLKDNKSGIKLGECKWEYNTTSGKIGVDGSYSGTFSGSYNETSGQTITIPSKSTEGKYYLHVLSVDEAGNKIETVSSALEVVSNTPKTYSYTASYQTFTAPIKGVYQLQVWGAQGANYNDTSYLGGKGGYSTGKITLEKGTTLYIYVGGQGSTYTGGYNGGGKGASYSYSGTSTTSYAGGGGTDMRFVSGDWNDSASLLSRVIVAGGGSGSSSRSSGYAGGGTNGLAYSSSYYGTQTTAGTGGAFGVGADSKAATNYKYGPPGGGGGWYGGGSSSSSSDSDSNCSKYAGGGSGYVWTSSTASSVPSGYSVNTKYYLTNASTTDGNTSFTSTSGGTETGHSGNGYAKITIVEISK